MTPGVIFDLGSTLIRFAHPGTWSDVLEESIAAMVLALGEGGLEFDSEALAKDFGELLHESFEAREQDHIERPISETLRQILSDFGHPAVEPGILELAVERYYSVSEAHWEPMPGLHDVLGELREAGHPLAIISNAADDSNVQRLIDAAKVRLYFDPIIVSADVGVRKPSRRIFEIVLQAWGVAADQVFMVGDTLGADIHGAQQVGMRTIWLSAEADTPKNRANRDSIVPDAVAETLRQVPGLIRRLDDSN